MPKFSAFLHRHFHFAHVRTTEAFIDSSKIILNGIANVLHRFLLGFSLRPTAGKRGAIHRVTFFRLMKHDLISEAHRRTLDRERHKLQRTLCRLDAQFSTWFAREPFRSYTASITQGQFVQSLTFGRLLQRKEGQRHPTPIFGLGSFFSYSFLSFFALSDNGEQHDPCRSLSGSILAEGRLERQFSVSDLG